MQKIVGMEFAYVEPIAMHMILISFLKRCAHHVQEYLIEEFKNKRAS